MYMSGSNPYMETTLVRLIDYKAINVVQNQVYLILRTNHTSLKTASNITRFDLYNIRKILKIGAHNWIYYIANCWI